MDELQAQRRLVKSPPELWAEVSDEDVLRRHLAPFGAIRITRREPESTVAWEGERASGTVSLDAAGWGTRVTLTAVPVAPTGGEPWVDPRRWVAPEDEPWSPPKPEEPEAIAEPEPEPAPEAEPEPEPVAEVPEPERRGWLARLFRRAEITPPTPPAPAPDPSPPVPRPDPTPQPPAPAPTPPDPTPPIEPPEPAPAPGGPTIEAQAELPAGEALQVLDAMLDHLGAAHHRPFSRG
jgi:hypothetical protein